MRRAVRCGLWSIRVNASGLRGCIASSRQAARAGRESTPHQPAHVHCTRSTHNAHQSQANPAQNLRTRVAPSRQAAHTNRKSTSYQSAHMRCTEPYAARGKRKSTPHQPAHARCTEPTGGAPNVSRLRLNLHMCIASSRHATHTNRKSTPRQPAHARCTEPTRDPHLTQVNFASIRTCAFHRADRRRAPDASHPPRQTRTCALYRADTRPTLNASQLRINPHMRISSSRQAARARCKSPPAPNPRTPQARRQSNRHIAKKVTVFAPFMYFMPHLPQSWLTFMQYASSELTA